MNSPSPADRVESALTPPWGPSLDHFLAARDQMKAPVPESQPPAFAQDYVSRGTGTRTPRASLPPPRMGPVPKKPGTLVLVPMYLP